jgi:hypothetical protein
MSGTGVGVHGPKGAGTTDVRVQRIEEGLPAFATVDNPTANPPSIFTFDAGKATGAENSAATGVLDTTTANGGGQVAANFLNVSTKWASLT